MINEKLARKGKQNGMYGVHRFGALNPFYGRKHTEEAKGKNRLAHLGKKQSKEAIEKMKSKLIGRRPWWLIGKPLSEEHKRKIRDSAPKGELSPHWKGGVTKRNRALRAHPNFKRWSIQVKERDNFTCQECGKIGGDLHSHHIKPFADYSELIYDTNNGITLCINCHRDTETYGRYIRENIIWAQI